MQASPFLRFTRGTPPELAALLHTFLSRMALDWRRRFPTQPISGKALLLEGLPCGLPNFEGGARDAFEPLPAGKSRVWQPKVRQLGTLPVWQKTSAGSSTSIVGCQVLSPEPAYGEEGSQPKIQRRSHLRCHLLSWVSQDVLSNDGVLYRAVLKEGFGWKKPQPGDEAKIFMKL